MTSTNGAFVMIARLQRLGVWLASDLGRWPRAGPPAEHLGWGARLLHFAPLALAGLSFDTAFFKAGRNTIDTNLVASATAEIFTQSSLT